MHQYQTQQRNQHIVIIFLVVVAVVVVLKGRGGSCFKPFTGKKAVTEGTCCPVYN